MKKKINRIIKGCEYAAVFEDDSNWYVDLGTGLGVGIYPKDQFSLNESIKDQTEYTIN